MAALTSLNLSADIPQVKQGYGEGIGGQRCNALLARAVN